MSLVGKPQTSANASTWPRSIVVSGPVRLSPVNSPPVLRIPGSWLTTGTDGSAARTMVRAYQ